MYTVDFKDGNTYINNISNFKLAETLDCGQAFRWESEDGIRWNGVAFGHYLSLYEKDGTVVLENCGEEDFYGIWRNYFDLDRDYAKIISDISCDETLKTAGAYGNGIRILNQQPWETLCSFIISQNNNIPRIKGIIGRLCESFGEKGDGFYTFPDAATVASLTEEDLSVLRCGFRSRYILDAARRVASGETQLESLRDVPSLKAGEELMKICGVGPKVADCVLLFGLGHIEAFPRDVWIKRAMQVLFNGKLPDAALPYAGIVQQYIFYYARSTKLEI